MYINKCVDAQMLNQAKLKCLMFECGPRPTKCSTPVIPQLRTSHTTAAPTNTIFCSEIGSCNAHTEAQNIEHTDIEWDGSSLLFHFG